MSRHRKQRLRRFSKQLASADPVAVRAAIYRLLNTGEIPSRYSPLERIVALLMARKELR